MRYFVCLFFFFLSLVSCQDPSALSEADTAWMIVASCLVMFMTPGLAFFYGGLVKQRSFVSILGQCLMIFSIATAVWTFIGYSLAFGESRSQFLGALDLFSLRNVNYDPNVYAPTIPGLLFYFYQNKFAAITPCLFIGATAERVRFLSIIILCPLWIILVYCPIAHWNWNINGFLHTLGVHDFAGGNVVHLSSGSAALVAAFYTDYLVFREKEKIRIMLKHMEKVTLRRNSTQKHGRQVLDTSDDSSAKESTAFVVLGTALLWFGWFGFNAGSALAANSQCILALINTNLAACSALITWSVLETAAGKKPSVIGMCVGAVCGLVGITPACGFVPIYASGIIGVLSSVATFYFYKMIDKCRYKPDDRLGVFGCHGISGITGSILIGFFADKDIGAFTDGIFQNGGGHLLGVQIAGVCCSFAWSGVVTLILLIVLNCFGLYRIIDEENDKEGDDFDEQAVFIPDIEKLIAKHHSVAKRDTEVLQVKRNTLKIESEFALMNQNSTSKVGTGTQLIFEKKESQIE